HLPSIPDGSRTSSPLPLSLRRHWHAVGLVRVDALALPLHFLCSLLASTRLWSSLAFSARTSSPLPPSLRHTECTPSCSVRLASHFLSTSFGASTTRSARRRALSGSPRTSSPLPSALRRGNREPLGGPDLARTSSPLHPSLRPR